MRWNKPRSSHEHVKWVSSCNYLNETGLATLVANSYGVMRPYVPSIVRAREKAALEECGPMSDLPELY